VIAGIDTVTYSPHVSSLWHNREFNLLWTSQSLSDLGDAIAQLAMPLLVLAVTGSAVRAGLVGTVAQVARLLSRLPGGVLADRVNRRRAMLACDGIRFVAFAGLAAAVATGHAGLLIIIAVAVVDAICGTMFQTTEHAALRSIVDRARLPDAVARNEARTYGTSLAGPPLGGLLFGLAPSLPFIGNAVSYLASLAGVGLIRKPLQGEPAEEPGGHRAALLEGVRFVFGNSFLRAVLTIAAPLNLALNGTVFTIIVTLQRHGVSPGVIGLTETIMAVGGLAGALVAPMLQRSMPFPRLVRFITWAATAVLATGSLLTGSLAAAIPLALAVFLGPACNAALFGYQAAITPDRLQGRVLSVIFMAAMSAAAAAPALAGLIVARLSSTAAVLFFAASVSVAALTATFAGGIRTMRPLEEVAPA
jgi:MFS family permease